MRGIWRVGVVGSLAAATVLATRGIAYAHAMLVSAEPSAGSVIGAGPPRIRLVFNEQIEASLATMSLVTTDGGVERLTVTSDAYDVDAVVAPLARLRPGAYRVVWRVVSADGHPVGGSFVFWVGTRTGPLPPNVMADNATATPTWGPTFRGAPAIPALLRGLAIGCAMALAGTLLLLCWPRNDVTVVSLRARALLRWLAWSTPFLIALHLAAWVMNASPSHTLLGGDSLRSALSSGVGHVELWRLALALLALWALLLMRRLRVALLFALALVTLSGATGHSAAIQPMQSAPAKALHLVAGSVWLGGLLWLLTCDHSDTERLRREAARVSNLAFWSVIAVTASGVIMALYFLSSARDLVGSAYGAVMLAKIVGLVALIGFGAFHRYRSLPSLASTPPQRGDFAVTLGREVTVMIIVILLGGLLAYVPPRAPVLHTPPPDSSVE